jgi:PAS domain-containing protein
VNALGTRAGEIESWIRSNLFDEVPMAVSVISRDFRIQQANQRFTDAFGPWEGRPCYEVYKKRAEPCLRCAAAECFVDGRIRSREEEGLGGGGHIDYLVHMVPMVRRRRSGTRSDSPRWARLWPAWRTASRTSSWGSRVGCTR